MNTRMGLTTSLVVSLLMLAIISDYWGRATPPAGSFESVSAGGEHTCGVRSDGSVACWGADYLGQATPPGE